MSKHGYTGEVANYYLQTGASQGWQCPVCKRILSPWTPECPCKGRLESFTTAMNTTGKHMKGENNE